MYNSSIMPGSTSPLSRSQYQENRNIPTSNPVKRIQHEQPSSIHLMKPKMDPSQQIHHYSTFQQQNGSRLSSNNNHNNSNSSRYRGTTPTRSPLPTGGTNTTASKVNQGPKMQSLTPTKDKNSSREISIDSDARQSRSPNSLRLPPEEIQKRSQRPINQQPSQKKQGGFFSCMGGGSDESQEQQQQQQQSENNQNVMNQLRILHEENNRLKQELESVHYENEQERQSMRQLRETQEQGIKERQNSERYQQEAIGWQQEANRLQQEVNILQQDQNRLQQEINRLQLGIQGKEREEIERRQEIEKIMGQLRARNQEIEGLKAGRNEKDEQINLLQKLNEGLQNNQDNNQRLRELENHCLLLASELEKLNRIILEKEQEIQAERHDLDQMYAENNQLKEQLSQLNQYQQEKASLVEQLSAVQVRNKQLEKDLFEAGAKMKSHSTEIDKLEAFVRSQSSESMKANEKLARENQQFLQDLAELRGQINVLEDEKQSVSGINQQLTQVVYQQERRLKEFEGQGNNLNELMKQLKDVQNQRDIAIAQKEATAGLLQQKEATLAMKDSHIAQKNNQYALIEQQHQEKINNEVELKRQLDEVNIRLLGWQRESDRIKEDKSREIAGIQAQVFDLKVQNQVKKKKERDIERIIELDDKKMTFLIWFQLKKLVEDNTKLAFELNQLSMKQQNEMNKQKDQMEKSLQKEFAREKDQLNYQISSMNSQILSLTERNRQLEDERIQIENERVKKSKNQQGEEEAKALLLENEKLRSNILLKEQNLAAQQRQLEEQQKKYEDKIRQLQQEKENNNRERELLSSQMKQLSSAVTQVEQEKQRLMMDLDFKLEESERQNQKLAKSEADQTQRIIELQEIIEDERFQNQHIQDTIIEHNAEKTSLETQLLKLKSQLSSKEQEVIQLVQENKILAAQSVERLTMIENWKKNTSSLPIEAGLLISEDSKNKIQRLEEELLKETHAKMSIKNQLLKYEKDLQNKEEEVSQLYKLLEKRKSDQEGQKEKTEELRIQMDQLRERAKQAEAESLIKTEYYDRWCLENDELQRQVNHYKEQLKNVEASMKTKSKEIDDNISEVKLLKSRYEDAISESRSMIGNESKSNVSLYSPISYTKREQRSYSQLSHANDYVPQGSQKVSLYDNSGNFVLTNNKYSETPSVLNGNARNYGNSSIPGTNYNNSSKSSMTGLQLNQYGQTKVIPVSSGISNFTSIPSKNPADNILTQLEDNSQIEIPRQYSTFGGSNRVIDTSTPLQKGTEQKDQQLFTPKYATPSNFTANQDSKSPEDQFYSANGGTSQPAGITFTFPSGSGSNKLINGKFNNSSNVYNNGDDFNQSENKQSQIRVLNYDSHNY